jgi:transposase InsO family protein
MQVAVDEVQRVLRAWFAQWGLPAELRLDHGFPWGSFSALPPDLALWLLGLGIALHWNRPRHKQGNAIVERAHGVCQRWVEAATCQTAAELQARLDYLTTLQRERYPHHDAPNRLAAYPALVHSGRPYDPAQEAAQWDERRVWRFLAQRVVPRRVDRVGRISLANRVLGVGRAWAGQEVMVRLAVVDETPLWQIRDARGTLLHQHPAPELHRERILALAVSRRQTSHRHPVKPPAHQEGKPYAR